MGKHTSNRKSRFSRRTGRLPAALSLSLALLLPGCGRGDPVHDFFLGGGTPDGGTATLRGFIGGVAADEPQAASLARDILARGGNAADAATALGFALSVTLPSRASLGAGGGCLAYNPSTDGPGGGKPDAILFPPVAPAAPGRADRPAAVPMLARGLFALHARYGKMPFEQLVVPAEQLARFGVDAARALTQDLAVVAQPLMADPAMRAVFAPQGHPLRDGEQLIQPELSATLSQLRLSGVGDLYQGVLANRLSQASIAAGGGLSPADLRKALPHVETPIVLPAGHDLVAFLPPPADGGLGAAAAFQTLQANPADLAGAQARAVAAVARWRQGGTDATQILAHPPKAGGALGPLPASTDFVVADRQGNAVACSLTMDNLFGTGRIAPGTGLVLAAAPTNARPLLSAAIAWNDNINAFRAAVAGSGQDSAALAVAVAMENTLREEQPMSTPVPDPGRANVIACPHYLPASDKGCAWATDPRGAGLAVGSD